VGLKAAGFSGCAALAVVVLALGAGRGWGKDASKKVSGPLTQLWNMFAQPLLFGLVGVEVVFNDLDSSLVGNGLLMLIVGLFARFFIAFLSMSFLGLSWKEKLFTAVSLMPKATVQAAIGGIALHEAQLIEPRDAEALHKIDMANQILRLSVLIIILTAPLGAMIIVVTGPKLLTRDGVDAAGGSLTLVPQLMDPEPEVIEQVRTGARKRSRSALPTSLIGNGGTGGGGGGAKPAANNEGITLLKRDDEASGGRGDGSLTARDGGGSLSAVPELEEPTPAVIEEVMNGTRRRSNSADGADPEDEKPAAQEDTFCNI